MKKPEKITRKDCPFEVFSKDVMLGYNQCYDEFMAWLPSKKEITMMIREYNGAYGIDEGGLAKALSKRIRGA